MDLHVQDVSMSHTCKSVVPLQYHNIIDAVCSQRTKIQVHDLKPAPFLSKYRFRKVTKLGAVKWDTTVVPPVVATLNKAHPLIWPYIFAPTTSNVFASLPQQRPPL